ncbi:hypothetical protein CANCADRAFT_113159 [Tortispora caseinolytica NRRL Y-17796]|uniref:Golgi SNAP receptor complex member 1 n=1 Tax=Tortispora caseinolytica NRRL Y-17796 TaxID=767744 RepID=A0A1E4TGK9_9ASCO|nr:hypothetical protein CANCADRAFT_113159 [Tortispora caseinolytica NRRL Y-17796]
MSFSVVRSELRQNETRTDELLAQLATRQSVDDALCREVDEILNASSAQISQLERLAASEPQTSREHVVQRHKEIMEEHQLQLRSLVAKLTQDQQRRQLLSSVKAEAEAYRSGSGSGGHTEAAEAEYMLHERGRIDNSLNMTDRILAQAYETRDEFDRQTSVLANVQRRVFQSASQVPGINVLISKINTRRKRDSLILSAIVTACFLMLWFFA